MLETGAFIAILIISVVVIKNKIACNRQDRDTKEQIEKKKQARQDRLDKALARSIR
jgi:hypothetical protein